METRKMKNCESCQNWIGATAECSFALKCTANGWDVPESVEAALELDANEENECEEYVG